MKFLNLFAFGLVIISNSVLGTPSSQAAAQIDGPTGGSFTVLDRRAEDEISEISRLYINGSLVATYALSMNHDRQEITVPIPLGRVDLPYVMCGEITIKYNGHIVTRSVSSEGMLHNPDGHSYEAIGAENFTDFYLIDFDDPYAASHKPGRSKLCTLPTS